MDVYVWEGRSRKGTIEKGEISANNEAAVRLQLRRQQIQAIKIHTKPKDILKRLKFRKSRRVKEKDFVVFTRQFATMIDAGLPLVQCLEILASQQDNAAFKEILLKVKGDVEAGSTFADALRKHPRVFNDLYLQPGGRGRSGRNSRHHFEPPGGIHREDHEPEKESQRRDGLPERRPFHRPRRGSRPAALRDPGVPEDVCGHGRNAPGLYAICHLSKRNDAPATLFTLPWL